ncbi:hypothetical protein QBC44DRAFT_50656 [Cladorrhinum sp. PSN332]|nr:hypothetical protein QBC44DRAFT_50656 [Cladorrhinum sp. PSN332]
MDDKRRQSHMRLMKPRYLCKTRICLRVLVCVLFPFLYSVHAGMIFGGFGGLDHGLFFRKKESDIPFYFFLSPFSHQGQELWVKTYWLFVCTMDARVFLLFFLAPK